MGKIKIYEFDNGDMKEWVASVDEAGAKKVMLENWDEGNLPPFKVLTDEEMDRLKHTGTDGDEADNPLTFRDRLNQYIDVDHKSFPCHFACTEA